MIRINMGSSTSTVQANQLQSIGDTTTSSSQAGSSLNTLGNGQMPAAQLESRQMGSLRYHVETKNLAKDSGEAVTQVMQSLLGDGSKVTLRSAHGVDLPVPGNRAVEVLARDPDSKVGRALVSVRVATDARKVCEVVFSRFALGDLAQRVSRAPVK